MRPISLTLCQLACYRGELAAQLFALVTDCLNPLLLSEDQCSGTGRPRQSDSI